MTIKVGSVWVRNSHRPRGRRVLVVAVEKSGTATLVTYEWMDTLKQRTDMDGWFRKSFDAATEGSRR